MAGLALNACGVSGEDAGEGSYTRDATAACLQSAGSGGERRLNMPTVLRAVRREMDKLGRATSREQFGSFADSLEE